MAYTANLYICNIHALHYVRVWLKLIQAHTTSVIPVIEAMVKAELSDTKNVSFPGVKATMLFKHDEQKTCDGVLCVRLNPRNRSLTNIVCEGNSNAPKLTKETTATCCKALAGMMHTRHIGQFELMKPAEGCNLSSEQHPKKAT